MARRRVHAPLEVFLNCGRVGQLRRESTGAIVFQYAREWLTWENAFPISLSLPLREDRYIGAPVINVAAIGRRGRLMAAFLNEGSA